MVNPRGHSGLSGAYGVCGGRGGGAGSGGCLSSDLFITIFCIIK
jgi:hypothetical protein